MLIECSDVSRTVDIFTGFFPVSFLLCSMDWLITRAAQKKLFVLPAFETAHNSNITAAHEVAAQAAAGDKRELASMERQGMVYQFALHVFKTVGCSLQLLCMSSKR
jgi:hypothetical protein